MNPIVLNTPGQAAQWLRERVRGSLLTDSRQVGAGDGFIAWPGASVDGRQFMPAALAKGASACLVEREGAQAFTQNLAPEDARRVASYPQLKAATGLIADAYYGAPSQALHVVAVTGTNGKTSTAWWLAWAMSALRDAALGPCALVGTLGVGLPESLSPTGMTTPDPVLLHRHLRLWADAGVRACAMEASSIGLDEQRLAGVRIRVAVFTNFTQDHLDYHGSMAAYWQAKSALFQWPDLQAAVINLDDARGNELLAVASARGLDAWPVALHATPGARLWAEDIRQGAQGLSFTVRERGAAAGGDAHVLHTALLGRYNISNLLGVLASLRALGVPLPQAARACAALPAVPGRMEPVSLGAVAGAPLVIVDYAHTPDALQQALQALQPLAATRGGRLWVAFGCGGNRDASKRPLMGAAAAAAADELIVTSDNPRDEKPAAIMADILRGLPDGARVHAEADRSQAIAHAVKAAAPRDVVLIAGKGHEDYQEIAGKRLPFSDQAQARRALAERAGGAG